MWGWLPALKPYLQSCNYRDMHLSRTKRRPIKDFIPLFFLFCLSRYHFINVRLFQSHYTHLCKEAEARSPQSNSQSMIEQMLRMGRSGLILTTPLGCSLISLTSCKVYARMTTSNFIWLSRTRWLCSLMESVNMRWRQFLDKYDFTHKIWKHFFLPFTQ